MTDRPCEWLALLDDHRSLDALDALRRRRLADGSAPETVHSDADRAQRIHRQLVDRKRHGDELTVLNDLARRLTALRDPREVLDEVAAQARRLLAVDIAYLMLVQADGRLRTEVVSGTFGTALQGIVLDRGICLAGEVLCTGRPLMSDDYLGDPAFSHVEAIDDAAASEHLGGLLAVPLLLGDDTIGVLCAAARERRRFVHREVELLSGLASHAAVAIANARLFAQNSRTLAELEQANATLRRTAEARQQANDLRDRLTTLLIRGSGLTDLVEELRRSLGGALVVYDADETPIAGDRDLPFEEATGGGSGADIAASPTEQLILRGPRGPVLVAKISLASGYEGCVVALRSVEDEATEEPGGLLAVGATALALYVASQRSVAEAELRSRGELVSALLSADTEEHVIRRRAGAAGIKLDRVATVAVFERADRDAAPVLRLADRLSSRLDGWCAEHAGDVVAFLPEAPPEAVRETLTDLSGSALPASVGLEACDGGVRGVRRAYETARQTVLMLRALERHGTCALSAELGPYRLLFSTSGQGDIRTFVDSTIGPLLEHDRRHGTDLVATLTRFLAIGQNHTRAAADLHIHPNTLYRRLVRITALLGADWRTPPRPLEVQIALDLHGLLRKV
ncbi:helix-turn-helix domain-containing protein [Streptomyces sp. NPDC102364]|uniref:helix-turn-helix domain-containing protein n=1 Tax=Streptomyces sp. NPDC102364 TaxID=3366161 RepID=UPI003816F4AF